MADIPNLDGYLIETEAPNLIEGAKQIAGFVFDGRPEFATAVNVSGLRSGPLTFSQRRDSRTTFAVDSRYGHARELGAWTGANRPLVSACRRVLRAAGIPDKEILGVDVVVERGGVAERISDTQVKMGKPQLLRKLARARRVVGGVPVWSSYAMVGITAKGLTGYVEVHWPRLGPEVVKEAEILQTKVLRGYKPNAVPGGKIESLDAGIIHSPAIGFFMDTAAAIRVVYVGDNPSIGRKVTHYLDRHGELVSLPRAIQSAQPEQTKRPVPDRAGVSA